MPPYISKIVWIAGGIIVFIVGALFVKDRTQNELKDFPKGKVERMVPVEVAAVQRGPLSLSRTFSGTIDPHAQFAVAPKVSGRIQRLLVDVSEPVVRGQVVVQMENAEFEQEVLEAEARLAVAEANRDEAVSRFVIAQRQLDRAKTLSDRGIASESAYDTAQAQFLTGQSAVKVAEANLNREDALLRAARIRLGYTQVKADWKQGDDERTVAERFVDEGNTVAANTSILSIVEIDPVIAVIQVTEKDYPLIRLNQQARVQADAFPDKVFHGTVSRISPVFRESSRQAQMEILVANPQHLLKPGMFASCTLELDRAEDAISVVEMAITKRNDQTGVFRVADDSTSVEWVEVKQGLKGGGQIQLIDSNLSGRVVTLGQQFIEDGSRIRIVTESNAITGGTGLQ
ncbi:efflux RND transporter periplasmic adaptor subunit [Desulforhopalus sp. IMCC35007]|uniref:efflux RND transporter periplasmic adaptor subunit n=1 Tax=Desulforhopalus sp. IMCC35007 TaxID=2569543 RepID=UPI0010AE8BBE|nr:efflux RND transporter periplasmic adaptor subunit [Desulforhopalus sp. IMCC35007]TKB07505.1 efflux RND transporter periplasmic adaptor subunit [Desulforhopalus sp. IMCC35007]